MEGFRELTFLEFLIQPARFEQYIDGLLEQRQGRTIRDIFTLYSMTMREWWVGRLQQGQPQGELVTFSTFLWLKQRNQGMYELVQMIGRKVRLQPQHFQCFLGSRQYAQHYLADLENAAAVDSQQRQHIQAYTGYVEDRFLMEDIKGVVKEELLKSSANDFVSKLPNKVNQLRNGVDQQLKSAHSQLLLELAVVFGLNSQTQRLLGELAGYLPETFTSKVVKYLQASRKSQSAMVVESPQPPQQAKPRVSMPILSPLYLRTKPKDRPQFIEKKLSEIFTDPASREIDSVKLILQHQLKEETSAESKASIYLLLLALNILQTGAEMMRQPNYLTSYALHNYNDIIELGIPSIKSIKWLAIALLYASNYFTQEGLSELKKFLGGILVSRRSADKSFIALVLIQGLIELKGDEPAKEKISEDFWKYLVDNVWLFQLVGNREIHTWVLSLALQQLIYRQPGKQFSNAWFNLTLVQLLQPETHQKFLGLEFQSNFKELELLSIIESTKRLVRQLEISDEYSKVLMLNSLTVQSLKLRFLLLVNSKAAASRQEVVAFLRECLDYLTTFHLACRSLTDKLPQYTDLKLFLKMLSIVYSLLPQGEPKALIAYQLAEENYDIEKIYQSAARNDIPSELFQFVDHTAILHVLLKVATTSRQEQSAKVLLELIASEQNYPFLSETRQRKARFRRQLAYFRYLKTDPL